MQLQKNIRTAILFGTVLMAILLFPGKAHAADADMAVPVASSVTAAEDAITPDTSKLSGTWTETADGRRYCFADGSYATGTQTIDRIVYLFDENGFQQTGWQHYDGIWRYYDPVTYTAAVGEQEIDGIPYLFDFTGAEKTGWRTVNGIRRYYSPESGKPLSGWVSSGGFRYYTDAETGKKTGEIQVNGIRYLLHDTYGMQQTGFCIFSDQTVSYYRTDGVPVSGWADTSRGRCYFNSSYVMQTGWQTIDSKQYYFNANGAMLSGFQTISGKKYYFSTSGVMQTGWQTINGKRYYFGSNGAMHTGWHTIDGDTYYFTETGCTIGTYTIDGKTYQFGQTGCLVPAVIAWQQGDGSEEQCTKYLTNIESWQNYPWTVTGSASQTVGTSACGLFSVINSVYYKTQTFLNPTAVADWAKANGYRTANSGIAESFFQAYANAYGTAYGFCFAGRMYTVDAALQHVRSGGTICANIPGHWIAVVDYNSKTGKYLLLDSAAGYPRCASISWKSTGVAWVSASVFTQNPEYSFFTGNRKIYALSFSG